METQSNEERRRHSSELFSRIGEQKQERVVRAAIDEFAQNGFSNANVNRIAAASGISIGALYKYFETKQDLFLYIVEIATGRIGSYINEILEMKAPFIEKVEMLVRLALRYSREDPSLIKLYSVFTSEGNSELASKLSSSIEGVSASAYRKFIVQAQEKGEVRRDIDPGVLAIMMDNQLMMLQFSYACEYYKMRFELYVGEKAKNDDYVVRSVMNVMRRIFIQG